MPRQRGSGVRWIGKAAIAILSPVLFLVTVEVGLGLFGYGRDTQFFVPDEGSEVYRTNPRFTELFFPASFGLKPLNFRITRAKPSNSVRIFVVGESAAMGVPEPGFGLAAHLRAQLQAEHPGKNIEVYNLGVTAINSHLIRMIVQQSLAFSPDLFVVYMGNNEVVGPYGPGSAITERMLSLPVIRASIWVRSTRTGQLIQAGIQRLGFARNLQDWRGMEMFAGHLVSPDDPRLQTVYKNFAANVDDFLRAIRRAGSKVLLSTVAVNVRDSAPFASPHSTAFSRDATAQWEQLEQRARFAIDRHSYREAKELLTRMLGLDPKHANTHFLLGRVLEGGGDLNGARGEYLAALQADALRFRADARINTILREAVIKDDQSVSLVDAAILLGADAQSVAVPAGSQCFFEHVHMNWRGNYELGRLLAAGASKALFGTAGPSEPSLEAGAMAARLGYTPIGEQMMAMHMRELTSRPPFTAQLDYADLRCRLERQIDALGGVLKDPLEFRRHTTVIERALQSDPANAFLLFHAAAAHLQLGNFSRAIELNSRLDMISPWSPEITAQRAFLMLQTGRPAEAETILLHAAKSEPYYFQTYGLLATVWSQMQARDKALAYFTGLVVRMPSALVPRTIYAQLLVSLHQNATARTQLELVLRSAPDNNQALNQLIVLLYSEGKQQEALDWMLKAFAYNPRNFENSARLEKIYEDQGDLRGTVTYMHAMAESGPVKIELYFDLASNLMKLGQPEAAVAELWRARSLATESGDTVGRQQADVLIRKYGL